MEIKRINTVNKVNEQKENKQIVETIQPGAKSRFLKLKFKTSIAELKTIITVGDEKNYIKDLAGYVAGERAEVVSNRIIDKLFNSKLSIGGGVLFDFMKLQASDTDVFTVNPSIVSVNFDGSIRKEIIDLEKYVSEDAYRDKILSLPVKFLVDGNTALIWDLSPLNADREVTITLSIAKEYNRIYNI